MSTYEAIDRNNWVVVYSHGVEDVCVAADSNDNLFVEHRDADGALESICWTSADDVTKVFRWMTSHDVGKPDWQAANSEQWEQLLSNSVSHTVGELVAHARTMPLFAQKWNSPAMA